MQNPIENISHSTSLPLMEHFYTIQGEGFHQGKAAYFIRLAGCDVGCVWCDVKESWKTDHHPVCSVLSIIEAVQTTPAKVCVITGGEPLMHNLDYLTLSLKEIGKATHIETSGAHPLSGHWDWICLSPKKFMAPLPEFYPLANELKIIIYNQSDFDWAETYASKMSENCKLFLQPEWSRESKMLPEIIRYVKDNPRWQISLQTHKYMQIP